MCRPASRRTTTRRASARRSRTSRRTCSGAARAGIQEQDVIIGVDDQQVGSSEELVVAVDAHDPGETITVEVVRGSSSIEVEATLDAA